MSAIYVENDAFAAAWLRECIADNLIAPGVVDERSIEDITPDELRPFRQVHLCAGIGVWSLAARLAGWPDDAPLWSASFPCQPFSAAGKGEGFADDRHIWPAGHYLIEQCAPPVIVGEQVAGADGDAWLDHVSLDMDATGYAFGAVETCAAGFGAPHERSRNYWVAMAAVAARELGWLAHPGRSGSQEQRWRWLESARQSEAGPAVRLADAQHDDRRPDKPLGRPDRGAVDGGGCGALRLADDDLDGQRAPGDAGRRQPECDAESRGAVRGLANTECGRRQQQSGDRPSSIQLEEGAGSVQQLGHDRPSICGNSRPGPVNGFWSASDWLRCRDEKWRPVEPGTFPLVDAGTFRNRVGLLRGAGNAITIGQAEGFIRAVIASISKL